MVALYAQSTRKRTDWSSLSYFFKLGEKIVLAKLIFFRSLFMVDVWTLTLRGACSNVYTRRPENERGLEGTFSARLNAPSIINFYLHLRRHPMRFLSWPCLLPPGETDWKANVNQLVAVWCSSSSSRASRMCNDVQCAFSIIYARASFPSSSSCLFQLVLEPLFLRKCTLCNRNTYNGDWRC